MTGAIITQQIASPFRRETASHLFSVGEIVRLKGFGQPFSPMDVYRITATLPSRENSLQYRIRNDEERHERVAAQDSLEPVLMSPVGDDAILIERTIGNGQRTAKKQSRDQKAEARKSTA